MRLDKLITDFEKQQKDEASQAAKLIIYDADRPETIAQKREKHGAGILIFLPDNGRDG